MTREEIVNYPKEFLTPAQVARITGSDPHYIRLQARADPEKLGYPVIVQGWRTKSPRIPFMRFMGWEVDAG